MTASASLLSYLDALVHPSVRGDELRAERHRAFIGVRLAGGACAIAALPVYLAASGAPGLIEAAVFAWLLAPIATAALLSRTGNLEAAYALAAVTLAGLVFAVGLITGGLPSFVIPWLLIVPLEAALSGSRRVLGLAAGTAGTVAIILFADGALGLLPPPRPGPLEVESLRLASVLGAIVYGAALALGALASARAGERLARRHEMRYRLLAQSVADPVTRHARSGGVVFASPAAGTLLDVRTEELLDNGLFERVHVADRPAYLMALADAARDGAAQVELRLRRGTPTERGPEFFWARIEARAVDGWPGAEGPVGRQVVATTRDISGRKRAEEELTQARRAAENADLAKARFMANMSHELRTPLNAILGFSEMLMGADGGNASAERRAGYAALIHESGQHLLSMVNGLLDLSRIESGGFELEPEPCEVGPLVAGCVAMLALKAEQAGIRLRAEVDPALRLAVLDKRATRQILINLLSNALKFTPPNGSVTVSAGLAGGELLLRVSDTGVGIAEVDLARLGQPFFQASPGDGPALEGSGLGLSVVKALAARHGGSFAIESRPGRGTCVTVRLPRQMTVAGAPAPESASVVRLPLRHGADTNTLQKRRA
ncbi:MAG TPA: PAS domain-containing sensor histidine kinase [Xanthobacteraceae bacterium]|nr:PAS domain-containing sensor histidine kinase [Xanthobacteraceae bacterium]